LLLNNSGDFYKFWFDSFSRFVLLIFINFQLYLYKIFYILYLRYLNKKIIIIKIQDNLLIFYFEDFKYNPIFIIIYLYRSKKLFIYFFLNIFNKK
jgi:hypothetical protein